MSPANDSQNKQLLNRTQIARAVFAAAESMGMADRKLIEQLTAQVIKRLEKSKPLPEAEQPLPGMEDLVPRSRRSQKPLPSGAEIQAIVEEILASKEKESIEKEEVKPKMEVTRVKSRAKPAGVATLTENALRVLERRYLKKDARGEVIETPEEMFRRVAQAIASAELI